MVVRPRSLQACTSATLGTDNFLTLTACNIGVAQSCALGLAQVPTSTNTTTTTSLGVRPPVPRHLCLLLQHSLQAPEAVLQAEQAVLQAVRR